MFWDVTLASLAGYRDGAGFAFVLQLAMAALLTHDFPAVRPKNA
jgi:hypothetical protein